MYKAKLHIRTSIATIALLFITLGAWADGDIVIIKQLEGIEQNAMSPGAVTVSESGATRTITVKPSDGYYLKQNGITALKTIASNASEVRKRAPEIDEGTIAINGAYPIDLSGEATFTFDMPVYPHDVEITVNFGNRININGAELTLDTDVFTYDGTAKTPTVTKAKTTDGAEFTLTSGTDYTIEYIANTNVPAIGSAQPTAIITAISKYSGTASKTFTINKATPKITKAPTAIEGLTESDMPQILIIAGEAEGGDIQYSTDGVNYSTELPTGTAIGTYTIFYKVVGDANHTDSEIQSLNVNIAKAIKKYDLWVNDTQVTEENANDVLGDNATNGGGSFQYFPKTNTLIVIANKTGANIKSEIAEGITLYLFAMTENMLGSITGTGKLTITTDGNFPGYLELNSNNNVISGFSDLELGENLGILTPENTKYANGSLATTSANIGTIIDPIVELKKEEFEDIDDTVNDLSNYIYDNRVLFTLKTGDSDDADGCTVDGGIVISTQMTLEQLNTLAGMTVGDVTPGTEEFMQYFTGITILVPAGEGVIEIDGLTMDGYRLGIRSLYTNELFESRQSKNEEREVMVFEYEFSTPTFVGIFNYGKINSARAINRAKKTVGSVTVYGVSVKPKQVCAANPAHGASGGDYTPPTDDYPDAEGQLPPIGQDPNNPDIITGIININTTTNGNGKWYNLNGQQIDEPRQKGLYINNGKKIFIK